VVNRILHSAATDPQRLVRGPRPARRARNNSCGCSTRWGQFAHRPRTCRALGLPTRRRRPYVGGAGESRIPVPAAFGHPARLSFDPARTGRWRRQRADGRLQPMPISKDDRNCAFGQVWPIRKRSPAQHDYGLRLSLALPLHLQVTGSCRACPTRFECAAVRPRMRVRRPPRCRCFVSTHNSVRSITSSACRSGAGRVRADAPP